MLSKKFYTKRLKTLMLSIHKTWLKLVEEIEVGTLQLTFLSLV